MELTLTEHTWTRHTYALTRHTLTRHDGVEGGVEAEGTARDAPRARATTGVANGVSAWPMLSAFWPNACVVGPSVGRIE